MKIDQHIQSAPAGASQIAESSATGAASGSRRGGFDASLSGDTVELSGASRLLQQSASERAQRVGRLAQAVRGGSYSIDAQAVSRALVREALAGAPQ